jgi:hypothetical protein
MILRRITEHVKAQNWTAVALDFVIVVLGVFIGIQVANWNAARAEEKRIAAQLTSFRNELILARDDLANRQAYYEARAGSTAELRERLESGNDLPANDFNRLTVSAVRGSGLNLAFRGYEELATTGAISKVADEKLRDMLYQWDTRLTAISNWDKILEDTRNIVVIPLMLEAAAFGNVLRGDPRYQHMTKTERFALDMDDIRANRAFDNALAIRQVQAEQQLDALTDFIAATEDLIAALDEEVAR